MYTSTAGDTWIRWVNHTRSMHYWGRDATISEPEHRGFSQQWLASSAGTWCQVVEQLAQRQADGALLQSEAGRSIASATASCIVVLMSMVEGMGTAEAL